MKAHFFFFFPDSEISVATDNSFKVILLFIQIHCFINNQLPITVENVLVPSNNVRRAAILLAK